MIMACIIAIGKLSKDNYDSWKLQIEAILVKNDHWNFVTGAEQKPEVNGDADNATAVAKWISDDQKAKAHIVLSIYPSELSQIKNCKTSHELWTKQQNIYESKGLARKAKLLKQLLFTKMTDSKNMSEHINEFFMLVGKLKEIEIANDLLTILLLYSIPESYENFRIAIESRDELPSPETLKIKLIEEANARKDKEILTFHDSQRALYSKKKKYERHRINESRQPNSDGRRNRNNNQKFKLKCNYCGIFGHKASICRKKQENKNMRLNNNKSFKNNSAMLAETNETKQKVTFNYALLTRKEMFSALIPT
ncbi:hypothetical protein AVEN_509-1 [Araneus ventricosus]|uniref:Retrovirus-related Pol polyprotein from transposon TNT 1-94 n=1 Tax=Araneus ventricosus TaxID=182803 RepID=A0A4Y2S1W4_ARAVE|nr:hypothetical protein AVEN_509-1 [Araneus ventricosus]